MESGGVVESKGVAKYRPNFCDGNKYIELDRHDTGERSVT